MGCVRATVSCLERIAQVGVSFGGRTKRRRRRDPRKTEILVSRGVLGPVHPGDQNQVEDWLSEMQAGRVHARSITASSTHSPYPPVCQQVEAVLEDTPGSGTSGSALRNPVKDITPGGRLRSAFEPRVPRSAHSFPTAIYSGTD